MFFSAVIPDKGLCTSSDVMQLQGCRVNLPGPPQLPEPFSRTATLLSPHPGTGKRPTETHMQHLGRQPTFQTEHISQRRWICPQNQEGFPTQPSSFSTYSPILTSALLLHPAPFPSCIYTKPETPSKANSCFTSASP